jgi:hypothetical protein
MKLIVGVLGISHDDTVLPIRNAVGKIVKRFNYEMDDSYFTTNNVDKRKNPVKTYSEVNSIMERSDILIIENTMYSNGIGFMVGKAAEMRKPTLVLYNKNRKEDVVPSLVMEAYQAQNKLDYKEYTLDTIEQIISDFINKAENLVIRQYITKLEPEHYRYIEWAKDFYYRKTVDVIRKLIEEEKSRDENWQKYEESLNKRKKG